MSVSEFRKWIEAGYRNYGKDPWFFIRELAQNSRDAGAKTIHINAGCTVEKNEVLVFQDDGCGMSYSHAKHYLFRLYASSKMDEKYSAGMFGIGFWTVLKFNPAKIIIESRYKKERWGVMVDGSLNTTKIPCNLTAGGTRITLIRPPQETSFADFQNKVREAAVRYCTFLRRNNRKADPLAVFFSGKNITQRMKLPGPVSLSFNRGAVEGAVGLAPRPRVKLYARGLPVWEGTTLEELSHTPPVRKKHRHREFGQGLAPVFLLNGNRLEVNISRKKVIENRQLQQVRDTAEKALTQMVQMAADCVSPRSLMRRFRDKFKHTATNIFHSFSKTLLLSLIIILPLEIFFLTSFYKTSPQKGAGTVLSIQAEKSAYSGASVRTTTADSPLDLTYQPPENTWFKLIAADDYHIDTGFLQTIDTRKEAPFLPVHCSQNSLAIELKTSETGKVYLPQPVSAGIFIDPHSVTLNRSPLVSPRYYSTGEVVIDLPRGGVIRYRCCPSSIVPVLTAGQRERLTRVPENLSLPPPVEKELGESIHLGIREKVKKALRLTASILKYDDSVKTAKKYARSSSRNDWLRKVINIGAGDCDILNGVTALFLRKMDVPARLVIGLIGRNGEIVPGLHAWTEYYFNGPHIVDATAHIPGLWETEIRGQKMPAVKRDGKGSLPPRFIIYLLAAALFLLFLVLLFVVSRYTRDRNPLSHQVLSQVEENLAGIALHALLHPGVWGRGSSIRNLQLIPTLNGHLVSLRQALKLGREQRLFTAAPANPLGPYLKKTSKSLPIIDSGNPAFAPLIKLLPGAVHLEKITGLRAVPPEKLPDTSMGQLLTAVNHRLQWEKNGAKVPPLLLAPGLGDKDDSFFDVDLSPLPSLSLFKIPNRFIAVNPHRSQVKELAALFEKNPLLAQFRLIRSILKESKLVPYPSTGIIEEVSHRLLKEME